MEEHAFHPLDYLSVVRRRKRWLIVPLVASIVLGGALALWLPKEYVSNATLGIKAPAVSTDLVHAGTVIDPQERARIITQQLTSRDVLQRVVAAERLAAAEPVDQAIAELRARVTISVPEPLQTNDNKERLDSFVLSYRDAQPRTTQRIAQRIAEVFVETASQQQQNRSKGTSAFIAAQQQASKERLDRLEEQLRKAKEAYMGRLPEQMPANLQMVSGLRQQLEANSMALRSEQDRLSMIERELEGMRQGSTDLPLPKDAPVMTADAKIAQLEQDLATARMAYTDKHPEVQRLQEELRRARTAAEAEKERPQDERLARLRTDPIYRQLTADEQTSRMRIRDLVRAADEAQRQITVYQARVEAAPMVEQQLQSVQREYELEKKQYGDLTDKLKAAQLAESLEVERGGERFSVLFPATLPTDPDKPNALRILLIALFVGLFLGSGLVVGREYLDRSVHDARALQETFELPVLAEIPRIAA